MRPGRRLRVCLVVPYDLTESGGVKHHALELARVLRSAGDDVTILGPSTTPVQDAHTVSLGGVVNIRSNGSDNRITLFVRPWKVKQFFRDNVFDVVHVHEPPVPSLPYWTAWLANDVPKICTFHAYSERSHWMMTLGRRLFAPLQFPFFERAIAVSEPAAAYARVAWRRPLAIVPNGVRTEVFRPGPSAGAASSTRPVRLLFVGRLSDPRKGLRYLLDAYRTLRARGVAVTLDVVGESGGASAPEPQPGLTYHGRVSLAGLIEHYQTCDVFVAPSTGQESFGIVLLEAMSCARPVVCSDIDGYRRTVHPEGALLVPPRDPAALVDALAAMVANPGMRHHMGACNRERARRFDWNDVTREVRDVYFEAIAAFAARRGALPSLPTQTPALLPSPATNHDADVPRRVGAGGAVGT